MSTLLRRQYEFGRVRSKEVKNGIGLPERDYNQSDERLRPVDLMCRHCCEEDVAYGECSGADGDQPVRGDELDR